MIEKLAFSLGRNDEEPNIELARGLAKAKNKKGIKEIVDGLNSPKEQIANDCIKVLYEVAETAPELVSEYAGDFIRLLKSKNNRLVWGGMTALSKIASLNPGEVFKNLDTIVKAYENGSVITIDNSISVFAELVKADARYEKKVFPIIIKHLENCRPKEVGQHAERAFVCINEGNSQKFRETLLKRRDSLTDAQKKRVDKLLKTEKKVNVKELNMSRYALFTVFILSVMVVYTSCGKEDVTESPFIQGLTINNYPKTDGSTSTAPLSAIIACRVLGIDYNWIWKSDGRGVEPDLDGRNSEKFWKLVKSSQTHQSFINLINKEADLIFSARKMSTDEKARADALGISLIETPIALDAFIFIVNPGNPITSLTIKEVQDIYTGKITRWSEVGGDDAEIRPYIRNANSGSQELMETLVMKDLDIKDSLSVSYHELVFSMAGALDAVSRDINSICYTVYYYKEQIANDRYPKSIAIEEVHPDRKTISDKSYPYTAEVYAVIRSDLDRSSMAYKLYEWIQTEAGKQAVGESGYIPLCFD